MNNCMVYTYDTHRKSIGAITTYLQANISKFYCYLLQCNLRDTRHQRFFSKTLYKQ